MKIEEKTEVGYFKDGLLTDCDILELHIFYLYFFFLVYIFFLHGKYSENDKEGRVVVFLWFFYFEDVK